MALSKQEKQEILAEYGRNERDTASAQVQIALLTKRLNRLNAHFKVFKKDTHSRNGLLKLVGQRRRLLRYLQRTDHTGYQELIKRLGIRK